MRGTPGGGSREEAGASGAAASSSGEGAEDAMCPEYLQRIDELARGRAGGREGVAGAWNGAGAGNSGGSRGRANSLAWAGGVG